jgi:hypothetical protein
VSVQVLKNGVRGGVPAVLEAGVAGAPFVVASGQDKGTIIVFEGFGMGSLFDKESRKPDGMRGGGSCLLHVYQ